MEASGSGESVFAALSLVVVYSCQSFALNSFHYSCIDHFTTRNYQCICISVLYYTKLCQAVICRLVCRLYHLRFTPCTRHKHYWRLLSGPHTLIQVLALDCGWRFSLLESSPPKWGYTSTNNIKDIPSVYMYITNLCWLSKTQVVSPKPYQAL